MAGNEKSDVNARSRPTLGGPEGQVQRIRVLVVDDEPTLLETVEAVLEGDFEVACCRSGSEALELLSRTSFDVVCTDYKMPGMDGMELITRIAALELSLGAVLMTGKAELYFKEQIQTDIAKTLPLSVVLKPYRVDELIDAINRAAAFVRMRRAVSAASRSVRGIKGQPL